MKNLVFDMGNVLIEWNSEKILKAITDDIHLQDLLRKEVLRLAYGWKPMRCED